MSGLDTDILGCWFDIYGYNGHGENEVGRIKIGRREMGLGSILAFMAGRPAGRRAVWVILHGIEYRPAYLILSETLRLSTIISATGLVTTIMVLRLCMAMLFLASPRYADGQE